MTNRERIAEKLVELTSYVTDLKGLHDVGWNEFLSNVMLRRGIERTLQVATECALDAGNMVISELQWRAAESNRDVFRVFAEQDALAEPLVTELQKAASFRNILVHQYTRVEPSIVFTLLNKLPPRLLEFRDCITDLL